MRGPVRAVATVAAGPDAPALRVRSLIPSRALQSAGIAVSASPLFTRRESHTFVFGGVVEKTRVLWSARRRLLDRMRADGAEIAVIHRQADLTPSLAVERAAAQGRWLVYDVDDAIWLSGSKAAGGHRLAAFKGSVRKAQWLAAAADRVIAGNELLAEWLSPRAHHVTVVPSVVDTARIEMRRHTDQDELVLGWIGSDTTAQYLQRLAAPISTLRGRLKDRALRLLVVGAPDSLRLDGTPCDHLSWSEDAERIALARMDVGVMPLPDDEWTRGKCAYKALQYMAAGIPVVADDVGVAVRVIDGGGYVVRNEGEWTEALFSLGQDPALRSRLGEAGRRHVEANYSVLRWAGTLAAILKGEA